jgi:hypothetical protein
VLRAFSLLPMLFAVLILRTDRRIVGELRQAKAISTNSAIPLHAPPVVGSWRLRRLADAGAICLVAPNVFYLDEAGYAAFRKNRRRRALLVLGVLLPSILILAVWLNSK